jgi:hypothetical protein
VLLACLLPAHTAGAEVALDEGESVFLFGDLRFRGETDRDSRRSDGSRRQDRDRARVRARLGLKWTPLEHLSFLARARTGNTDGQQSPHVTIWQDGDDGDADVLVDRAWVKGSWSRGEVWLGRNGHGFWRQDEFLFDDDVYFDGLGFRVAGGSDSTKHELRGTFAAVPEGDASLSWDDQGWLSGLQYALHHDCGEGRGFSVALSGLRFGDDDSHANPVLRDLDATIWALQLQARLRAGDLPVTLGADLLYNSDAPPQDVWNRDERTGWALFAKFGGLSRGGDWLAGAFLARVEEFALVPFLAQDDWLRWGSATQTRSSNYEGLELRFGYAFRDDMNLVARLYLVDGIELRSATATHREDGKRFRIDLNWKF